MIDIIKLSKDVRIFRLGKRLTQTELGTKVGVSKQYIYKLEKGKQPISATMLNKIYAALDLDLHVAKFKI